MRDKMGQLWVQTHVAFYILFVCTYTHNSKTKGDIQMLYLLNDCSTIEDTYFLG